LFSGIGGFSLAGRWLNWRTIQFCEIDKFCQKILSYHWSDVPIHEDIKTLTVEQILNNLLYDKDETTIVTGGFPCQPYSLAGKRKGTEDARNLWPQTFAFVEAFRSDWCVFENVPGLVSWDGGVVFNQVLSDLESADYEVQAFVLPACAVNAPHRRNRVWFIGHNKRRDLLSGKQNDEIDEGGIIAHCNSTWGRPKHKLCPRGDLPKEWVNPAGTTTNSNELRGREEYELQQTELCEQSSKKRTTSKPNIQRCYNRSDNREERHIQKDKGTTSKSKSERKGRKCGIGKVGSNVTNTKRSSCKGELSDKQRQGELGGCDSKDATNTDSRRQSSKEYRETKSGQFAKESCSDNWQNFPTQSPICGGNDGLPERLVGITFPKWRNESIKAFGNSIVPQVAFQLFKTIEKYIQENENKQK